MFGGGYELLIVAAVFLLLFGGAKLPSLMRNMGRSVNEFKTGMSEKPVPRKLDADEESDPIVPKEKKIG
jgi:sec-independent protein translocase protein TatA